MTAALDLAADPVALTAALVDIPSVSGAEGPLADAVEQALRALPALEVLRFGDAVVARTSLGRATRTLLAGHLDTVPIAANLPSRSTPGVLHGCGSTDMKSGVAVMLHIAALCAAGDAQSLNSDLTLVFYDNEEVEASRNGLGRLSREQSAVLAADLAVLLEPTAGLVEAGCQGTLKVRLTAAGRRAHSARSWLGVNAIHQLSPALQALAAYHPRSVTLDGCTYLEGLSAVSVSGGVAGNVIPDEAAMVVNYRFAPDRSEDQALAHVEALFAGHGLELEATDSAPGALPRLAEPATTAFVDAVRTATGEEPRAKYGWTDVARFAALGIPAVNFGPGDPDLAHTREEYVETARIIACSEILARVLQHG